MQPPTVLHASLYLAIVPPHSKHNCVNIVPSLPLTRINNHRTVVKEERKKHLGTRKARVPAGSHTESVYCPQGGWGMQCVESAVVVQ
jgi:hypothetical protein